ncbi:MAG: hypothetical protein ACLQGU_03960 [bacterium]
MKLRTRSEMRLYQRARRAKIRGVTPGVTGDVRRVIRVDGYDNKWFPPQIPLEQKLLEDLREQTRIQEEADEEHEKIARKLAAHYQSLGSIDPEQCATRRHLAWILLEIEDQRRGVSGVERKRLDALRAKTIGIMKQRYPDRHFSVITRYNYDFIED